VSDAEHLLQLDIQLALGTFSLQCQLNLPTSGFTVICGRSGCGKTTLLRCIAGLAPNSGSVRFRGTRWQDAALHLPPWQRPVAYVFQQPTLFPHLTVRGNLLFALKRVPPAARRIQFDDAVSWLGLEALLERKPAALSGGQQQRVAVTRALLANPELLLMDEPLASLDIDSKLDILPYLERLRSHLGIPVIYVTHAPDEMSRPRGSSGAAGQRSRAGTGSVERGADQCRPARSRSTRKPPPCWMPLSPHTIHTTNSRSSP
jgi:molybdate transport system ATP-binding protein